LFYSLDSWINILGIVEAPSMFKISQKQYTFLMHLIDEIGLFIDILDRNKIQADLIKQKSSSSSSDNSSNPTKITICLTTSTTFTLAVIDSLTDEIPDLPTPRSSSLLGSDIEPIIRDTSDANAVIDLITTPEPIIASTAKVELSTLNKSKFEENIPRELEMVPKGLRASSISLSMNMSDYGDETASQLDSTEDLDADLDLSLFINDSEQQQEKVTRIKLDDDDDDCISLTEKMYMPRPTSELVGFFFVRK